MLKVQGLVDWRALRACRHPRETRKWLQEELEWIICSFTGRSQLEQSTSAPLRGAVMNMQLQLALSSEEPAWLQELLE